MKLNFYPLNRASISLLILFLLGALTFQSQAQTTRYVSTTGTTPAGGATSWATSTTDLQGAINASASGDQVWVARGTYKPGGSANTNPNTSFAMKEGVAIYGGFVGSETSLSARPALNPVTGQPSSTTLSGDIGTVGNNADNTNTVIINTDLSIWAILDGFVITGGKNNSGEFGGGIFNNNCSPSLTNLLISGNSASRGGGIFNLGGSPSLTNCTISGNTSDDGGGINNLGSSPLLINCLLQANSAGRGGGINNINSSPLLINCLLQANSANLGGGIYNSSSSPRLINGTLTANRAMAGAALINYSSSQPSLTNTILWDNQESANTAINNDAGTGVTANYCLIGQGETDFTGTNNQTAIVSPFVSGINFMLKVGSQAIDTGDNEAYTSTGVPTTDLVSNPRIANDRIDIGAYEFQAPPTQPIRYVRQDGTGDGTSWANASGDLQSQIDIAGADQVWVAGGRYTHTSGGSFLLKNGVAVYGGFRGGENSLGDRPGVNPVGGQPSSTTLTTASGSVVRNVGLDNTARLDGVVITGGNSSEGGGINNGRSSPMLTNCVISGNSARMGVGIYNSNSNPVLTNCVISGNTTTTPSSGGGGYLQHRQQPGADQLCHQWQFGHPGRGHLQ